jgi:hypothetical protein
MVSPSQLYYDNHIWLHVSTFQEVIFRPSELTPLTNSQYVSFLFRLLTLECGTDRLSWNIGKKLPLLAVQ